MTWFNYYGLIFMVIIMIPNIIFAVKNKGGTSDTYKNKTAEIFEQIGRYACFILMVFNIPYTFIGFYFSYAEIVYLIVNSLFVLAYCLSWIILWKKSNIVKALLLSIIPSLVFLFSGVMIASIPLIVFAIIFAINHILISVKNVKAADAPAKTIKKSIITVTALFLSVILIALSVLGGIIIYGQNSLSKLDGMSALDMINYDCKNKSKKISVNYLIYKDIK